MAAVLLVLAVLQGSEASVRVRALVEELGSDSRDARDRAEAELRRVCVIDRDGSGFRVIADEPDGASDASWAPRR